VVDVTVQCGFRIGLVAFLLWAGCAAASQIICPAGEERSVNELRYFATAKPSGVAISDEWEGFLRTSITPRFPKGFTYWQAAGQWQACAGIVIHENTFVLSLVHLDDDQRENAMRTIATKYKRQFNQEAVLRVKDYV